MFGKVQIFFNHSPVFIFACVCMLSSRRIDSIMSLRTASKSEKPPPQTGPDLNLEKGARFLETSICSLRVGGDGHAGVRYVA